MRYFSKIGKITQVEKKFRDFFFDLLTPGLTTSDLMAPYLWPRDLLTVWPLTILPHGLWLHTTNVLCTWRLFRMNQQQLIILHKYIIIIIIIINIINIIIITSRITIKSK